MAEVHCPFFLKRVLPIVFFKKRVHPYSSPMIKKITPQIFVVAFIAFITVLFIISCNNQRKVETQTVRDTSITATNAYSKFFIDSAALEKFIAAEVSSDTISSH